MTEAEIATMCWEKIVKERNAEIERLTALNRQLTDDYNRRSAEIERLTAVINSDQTMGPGGYAYWCERARLANNERMRKRAEVERLRIVLGRLDENAETLTPNSLREIIRSALSAGERET